jgi:hypothetical protein
MQETGVKVLELTSPWMERTKWAYVYEGTRRDLLVKTSEVRKAWSYNQDFPIGQHEGVNLSIRLPAQSIGWAVRR